MNLFWEGFSGAYNSVECGQAVAGGLPFIILMFVFCGLIYKAING